MFKLSWYKNQSGMIIPLILVMTSILLILAVSLMTWTLSSRKDVKRKIQKVQSLQVAEAGVNYYKWHLSHNSSDFMDGNDWCCNNNPALTYEDCSNVCGPYEHEYKDYNDNVVGEFSLRITPAEVGSTVVAVESSGVAYGSNNITKKVSSYIGKRSLAEFSFLSASPIWIGGDEGTSGPLHSNGGIRFDGTSTAEVTSAVATYNCSSASHGCSGVKDGIWGTGGPDTFWRFPVPVTDFDLFSVSLANMKIDALTDGIYYDDSGDEGYFIEFLSDATVDIYTVDSLESKIWYYNYESGNWKKEAEEIQSKTLLGNFAMPSNGLIFIEDDVWVQGSVNGKVTLAAARFPENANNYARIRINGNINYIARDGNHNLGLMSQGDVLVPRHAPADLTIDAMMLSQRGHVYYRYYDTHSIKNSIEVYGGIITNLFWTWTWVDGSMTTLDGYNTTNTIYNNNLTFNPPPSFPTSENFEVLSWKEE
ncbi:MAG: hypothetical protein KAS01_01135 [Candidatus Pacebacteria bacterium]|nr:hypothetical protein [Candidatus Paceibacterota bacterium]